MQLPVSHIPASAKIHIIAPFASWNGGDWHAVDLYLEYSKTHKVTLWSSQVTDKALSEKYHIKQIKPYSGQTPQSGVLIISGARTEIGQWFTSTNFTKIALIHNLISPTALYKALNKLSLNGKNDHLIEVIYMSKLIQKHAGLAGKVIYHLPSTERFKPIIKSSYQNTENFVVGRVSGDKLAKYHHSDMQVFSQLADAGIQVKITGGTCLTPWLGDIDNIKLSPVVPQADIPAMYQQLDCFYYRVPSTVKEAFGFVILEAMMSGLPVVCHRDVGAAEIIEHEVNGFVFDTPKEAIEIMMSLKQNANLREKIGVNARKISLAKI